MISYHNFTSFALRPDTDLDLDWAVFLVPFRYNEHIFLWKLKQHFYEFIKYIIENWPKRHKELSLFGTVLRLLGAVERHSTKNYHISNLFLYHNISERGTLRSIHKWLFEIVR